MNIRDIRTEKKITLKALSEGTGIPYRTLQKYEKGECEFKNMTLRFALKLAEFFDLTLEDLKELSE